MDNNFWTSVLGFSSGKTDKLNEYINDFGLRSDISRRQG